MARRGESGLSLVVGVDKPQGMSSHDVVNRCRRIFGERRCGHTGTLDPAATGALLVCVGPATRLDRFLSGHSKTYEFSVVFGQATDTDDAEGRVLRELAVPPQAWDAAFAAEHVRGLVGEHNQLPPAYSAVKVAGRKSYEAARAGTVIDLSPRRIEVASAELVGMAAEGPAHPQWIVRADVGAGTYIRAIARDMGAALGTCAHVGQLRRLRCGGLDVRECLTLEQLAGSPDAAALDPVRLLGFRFAFLNATSRVDVSCGRPLRAKGIELFSYGRRAWQAACSCTSGVERAGGELQDGELVSMVDGNRLCAIYAFDEDTGMLRSACGFAVGVDRGSGV